MDYGDLASVEAALVSAAQADDQQASASEPAPVAPVGETAPVQPQAQPEQTPAPAAPVDTPPNLFEGTPVNPDQLPAELQPLAKQLQAAYTQKTQTLAEERKQWTALGTPEEVSQAVELYTRISNPTNWPQLHSDLSDLMQQYGMSPAQAAAEATTAIAEAADAGLAVPELDSLGDDPELAPLYKTLQQQQAEIAAIKAERQGELTARQEQEQAERLQQAIEGELIRQTNAIMTANPQYGEGDLDAITELSSFYGGNLIQAQQRYENLRAEWVGRYVDQKQSVASAQGVHPAPAGAPVANQWTEHETVKAASDDIEEYFRQLQAAGEFPDS
jgi:hypothetical protein